MLINGERVVADQVCADDSCLLSNDVPLEDRALHGKKSRSTRSREQTIEAICFVKFGLQTPLRFASVRVSRHC